MKMHSLLIAVSFAALLGLSAPAHADRDRGQPRWAAGHHHQARHEMHHWRHHQRERIRHQSYRRGYRDGYRDRHWVHSGYGAPRHFGHSGYGLNVWLDGIGVSYYESGRHCH